MTQQLRDMLAIGGRRHVVVTSPPLFAPGDERATRFDIVGIESANRSGIVTHWQVAYGRLYLVEVEATAYRRSDDDPPCDRRGLYTRLGLMQLHDETGPVRVDWFSGAIDLDLDFDWEAGIRRPTRLRRLRFAAGRLVSDEIVAAG